MTKDEFDSVMNKVISACDDAKSVNAYVDGLRADLEMLAETNYEKFGTDQEVKDYRGMLKALGPVAESLGQCVASTGAEMAALVVDRLDVAEAEIEQLAANRDSLLDRVEELEAGFKPTLCSKHRVPDTACFACIVGKVTAERDALVSQRQVWLPRLDAMLKIDVLLQADDDNGGADGK